MSECARCEDDSRVAGRPGSMGDAAERLLRRCFCGAVATVRDPVTGKWFCAKHAPRVVAATPL